MTQDFVDEYFVSDKWVSHGTYALVVRDPMDQENEMAGEYQILIGKEFYYSPEEFLESIIEE